MRALNLHSRFTQLVKSERKITDEVLRCINEIDITRAFAELGYGSLFDYLVSGQKYSEGAAQRRISAARLLREIPELNQELQDGSVNLTQLSQLQMAARQEQKMTGQKVSTEHKKKILGKIKNKRFLETQEILAQELTALPAQESVKPQKDDSVYLTVRLTSEQFAKLREAQNQFSHVKHDSNYADIIEILCDTVKPKETKSTAATAVKTGRSHIPNSIRREIFQRARGECEFIGHGRRCGSRFQVQLDHIQPLALGGTNKLQNLRILCRTHNLLEARRAGVSLPT